MFCTLNHNLIDILNKIVKGGYAVCDFCIKWGFTIKWYLLLQFVLNSPIFSLVEGTELVERIFRTLFQ